MDRKVKSIFIFSLISIYIFSVIPVQALPPTNDKLNHIAAFLYLALLGSFWIDRARLFLLLFSYGVFIELTQLFVPGRCCDWKDVVADTIGIAAGFLLFSAASSLLCLVGKDKKR
ncbi:VanZ family protein [Desulfurobacterium sp.]|uniref:VanZ family protein n=1 Tax=Desulfurobacterium sp. TaxID=2004706 RepID=UPI0003B34FF2|nr:VanZ family protein [Desulfurobacterium sp.]